MTEQFDFIPTETPMLNTPLQQVNVETDTVNDITLSDEMVMTAVYNACEFFNIPNVPIVNAEGTCVWANDATTYDDDVFGLNREELMSLGISGEDSLTLIYTHECAHRTLQSTFTDPWEEELACDFFAGVHAGMKDMDLDNFEASLGQTSGSSSHPNGALRADFIEYGKQVAEEMQSRGIEVTYEGCIQRLNQHLQEKDGLIVEYRERFDDSFGMGITDAETVHTDGEAKGFVNDRAWNEKQANENFENARWHEKEAERAAERGDHSVANDHLRTARSYNSKGNDYLDASRHATK